MPLISTASFKRDKYNSIHENFVILIIDVFNVTIQIFKYSNSNHDLL